MDISSLNFVDQFVKELLAIRYEDEQAQVQKILELKTKLEGK